MSNKKRSGASKKLNVKSKKIIRESRGKKKGSIRKLAKKVKQSGTTSVSHQTIWRFQRKERMKPYKRRQEPLYSTKNIQSRTQFAAKYGSKSKFFWDKWLFTDEKYFGLSEKSNSKNDVIWTDSPNKVPVVKKPKNDPKIMVWGGMSSMGLTPLIFFEQNEKLTAQKYIRKVLIPIVKNINEREEETGNLTTTKLFKNNNDWIYQQDGASSHTAKNIQTWLSNNVQTFVPKSEWPGNSPDLNPIENLWSIMESKLYERGNYQTIDDLIENIKDVWQNIPVATLQKLSRSMQKRLKQVKDTPDKKANY